MTRWDSPLFTVPYDDEQPPCEAIWEAIVGSDGKTKIVKPNQATITVMPLLWNLGPSLTFLVLLRRLPRSQTTFTNSTEYHKTF